MVRIGVVGTKDGWSSERLATTVSRLTGFGLLIEMDQVRLDFTSGDAWYEGINLVELDALIIKKIGGEYSHDHQDRLEMLRYLNEKGLPVFSSPFSIMRVLDRLSCTVTLRVEGIPMPPTTITANVDEALDAVRSYGEAVFKPIYTSKARGMRVISDSSEARKQIEAYKLRNPIMYIQKRIDLNGRDLGVAFLGGEYLATYARCNQGNSWTTSTFFGGKYQSCSPSQEIIEVATKAQSLFGLDFTCVDVVETDKGPAVFEVSAFGGFKGLLEANGIDAAELYAEFVLSKLG